MVADDVIYMFAMSLDGFIAREDGTFDWLDNYPPDDDFDFSAFMASVTGIVMGRDTYDIVKRHEEWPYAKYPTVIAHKPGSRPSPRQHGGDGWAATATSRQSAQAGRIWPHLAAWRR